MRVDQQHRRGIGHKKASEKAIVTPLVAAGAGMNRLILRQQLHGFKQQQATTVFGINQGGFAIHRLQPIGGG